jgi:acyl-coenzyme A thioesterase PaaI-like protein
VSGPPIVPPGEPPRRATSGPGAPPPIPAPAPGERTLADASSVGPVGAGRRRFVEALRALVDAAIVAAPDLDDGDLDAAAAHLEELAARLGVDVGAGRDGRVRTEVVAGHADYLPRSPLVGVASPLAPPFAWRAGPAGLEATGTFGAPYEGPPGYVHGGWIALAFDEVLGMANIAAGRPGMTARLSVHYHRPTPLHAPVTIRAAVDHSSGRRTVTAGELRGDGELCATAEGLFVTISPERAARYFAARRTRSDGA